MLGNNLFKTGKEIFFTVLFREVQRYLPTYIHINTHTDVYVKWVSEMILAPPVR